jgi:hypothetical protein
MFSSSIDFLTNQVKDMTRANRRSITRISSSGDAEKLASLEKKTGELGKIIRVKVDNLSKRDSMIFFQNAMSLMKAQEDSIVYAGNLYAQMQALAQEAQSSSISSVERDILNDKFVELRELALNLNDEQFLGTPLFDEMAGSRNYDVVFGEDLIRKNGDPDKTKSEEKDVIYSSGRLTISISSGPQPERYRVFKNGDTIFDTGWWKTSGSAAKHDYDTFVINYKYGEDTTFEFLPSSAGNNVARWLPDEPLPDDTYHNKPYYLSQLGLVDDGSTSGVESQIGQKWSNENHQGQIILGTSSTSEGILKIQVDTTNNPTIYQIRGKWELPDLENLDVGNIGDLNTFIRPLGLGLLRENNSAANFPKLTLDSPSEAATAFTELTEEMNALGEQIGILANNMSRVLSSMDAVSKQLGIQQDIIYQEPEKVVSEELANLAYAREMRTFNASLMNKVVQVNHDMIDLLLM